MKEFVVYTLLRIVLFFASLGVVVGVIVIAMFLPLLSVINGLSGGEGEEGGGGGE